MALHPAARLALTMALALTWPIAAQAQSHVFAQCAAVATPMGSIRFENDEHKAWYLRFWTGECIGTHSFCMPGSPDWITTVTYVAEHAPPAQRTALVTRTCKLGQLIGMEWARDPRVKRIKVADLRALSDIMKKAPDMNTALNEVSARVATLMARPYRVVEGTN